MRRCSLRSPARTWLGSRTRLSASVLGQARANAEREIFARHDREFWGLLHLGDAIHQFYRDTIHLVGEGLKVAGAPSDMTLLRAAMVNWHLVSFNRYAAAYHLAAHGYYFDSMALGRDLWEVALSLAALERQVLTVEELLGTDATSRKDMVKKSKLADQRVRQALVDNNAALGDSGRDAVTTYLQNANTAMHKSKLQLARHLRAWDRREWIAIFPSFDMNHATAAYNMLCLASWSLISTLPYLDFALAHEASWPARYEKVQLAYRVGAGDGNDTNRAWPSVIRAIFSRP